MSISQVTSRKHPSAPWQPSLNTLAATSISCSCRTATSYQAPVLRPAPLISVRVIHTNTPRDFYTWLRGRVYDGREVPQLLRTAIAVWSLSAVLLFGLGAVLDFYRRKRAREGIKLRGGALMTIDQFNRATRGDGFALYVRK